MAIPKRKQYFVKKDFQSRFILRFVVTATLWVAAAVAFFAYLAEQRLEKVMYSPHISVKTGAELLMPSMLNAHMYSLLIFAALLAYTIYALWTRLSVPLHSLKKDLKRIASGDLASDVVLREEEEFQDLAGDLDAMRGALKQKFIRMRDRHAELSHAVFGLDRVIMKGNPSLNEVAALKNAAAHMKEALNDFTYS